MPAGRERACLDADTASAYFAGTLTEEQIRSVDAHVDTCPDCRRHLSELARIKASAEGSLGSDPEAPSAPPPLDRDDPRDVALAPGTRVDRYVIETAVGRGGMGVVYRARDPELRRAVALKMVRGFCNEEALQGRLRREAQAMARLSHPNVVAVYDIVVDHQRLFIAMEFIEGPSLTAWLGAKRSWREVLEVFAKAGRGLAAAHEVGLVHRDFKPDNVLIDEARARVCVTDFGLARVGAFAPEEPTPPRDRAPSGDLVTRAGALLGTPAYMAPEQHRKETADARSDQFSFCVALYEALYDQLPFEGETLEARANAAAAGRIRTPRAPKGLPPSVHRALLRGLRPAPEDRHPSMVALLDALAHAPKTSRRLPFVAGAALCVATAVLAALAARHDRTRAGPGGCVGAERRLAGVWDNRRKEAVSRAFVATGKPYASDAWRGTERALDAYAREWSATYTETCAAPATEQSTHAHLLRMACLEDRLVELRTLTDLFTHADDGLVGNAVGASESLERIPHCLTAPATATRPPPPEALARVLDVRRELAQVDALFYAQSWREARPLAERAVERARATGYGPLVAKALYDYGRVLSVLGDEASSTVAHREAAAIADASGDDRMRALAHARLLGHATTAGQFDVVAELRTQALSIAARLGDDDEVLFHLRESVARSYEREGKVDEAVAAFREVAGLAARVFGARAHQAGLASCDLAYELMRHGDYPEALSSQERCSEILRGAVGPENPLAHYGHLVGGIILIELLQTANAEGELREALRIAERDLGPDEVADTRDTLGWALSERGKYAEALALHESALAVKETRFRRDHPDLVYSLVGCGRAHVGAGEAARAIPPLERALGLDARGKALEHAEAKMLLARALREVHRTPARARELALDARAWYRASGRGPRQARDLAQIEVFLDR